MKIEEIIDKKLISNITDASVIGIDIGSRTGKAILLCAGNCIFL